MNISNPLFFLLLAACSITPVAPVSDASPPDADEVDSPPPRSQACIDQDAKLQAALDGARTSPNAMLAVKNVACGTSVYVSGDAKSATVDSLWRIGSITKTYVSASILSLVKDGTVSLDDPLSKWVPNVANTSGVTVRMLLDHRSGIFNYTEDPTFVNARNKPWTPQELVDLATAHPPYFAPDADIHYSNTNYVLLGMILEAATTEQAGAVLHERALDKAKLEATFFDGEDAVEPSRMARGFSGNQDVTFYDDPSGPWCAGAMVASGADLADWVFELYATDDVLDASQRALLSSTTSPLGQGVKYGLGVILLDASITGGAGPAMGHDGGIDGFNSQAFWFPDKETAIAVVVNDSKADPNAVSIAAMTVLF